MAAGKDSGLEAIGNAISKKFQTTFFQVGEICGRRPKTVIAAMFFVVVLAGSGMSQLDVENRGEVLWVPQGTEAFEDMWAYESLYSKMIRPETLLVTKTDGSNVLDKDFLLQALAVHNMVEAIVVEGLGESWNLQSLCVIQPGDGHPCLLQSIFGVWNYDTETLSADSDPIATLTSSYSTDALKELLGEVVLDESTGEVMAAGAVFFGYYLENRAILDEGPGLWVDEPAENWEEAYLLLRHEDWGEGVTVYVYATRSIGDEFGDAISGDIAMMSMAILLMIIYLNFNMGPLGSKHFCSNLAMSMASLGTVGLAVPFSYGIASYAGNAFSPVHGVLPFILMGIGVDDSFVIINSFGFAARAIGRERGQQQQREEEGGGGGGGKGGASSGGSVEERVTAIAARAMSDAGTSVTVTSLTDVVAFAIGSSTAIPALSSFCVFASLAILGLYVFQCSVFCSCVVLRFRAQERALEKGSQSTGLTDKPGRLNMALEGYLGPAITKPVMKPIILAAFVGLLVWGAVGMDKLQVEDITRSFIPDGSYLIDTFAAIDRYFIDRGVVVYIVTNEIDYFGAQDQLSAIPAALDGYEDRSPYIKSPYGPTFHFWYTDFTAYLRTSPDPPAAGGNHTIGGDDDGYETATGFDLSEVDTATGRPMTERAFYAWLRVFLGGEGARYQADVIFDEQGVIISSRLQAEYKSFLRYHNGKIKPDSQKQVDSMDDTRALVKTLGLDAYAFTHEFIGYEGLKILYSELFTNLLLAAMAVFVITLFLISNLVTSLLVTTSVIFTMVELMGVMYAWDLPVDTVSVINLVLAIGLCVDYSAHIGHQFMMKTGVDEGDPLEHTTATRNRRVVETLGDIGGPVVNGAFSTFLAVVLLSGSESYVFRSIFRMFFATCLLGVVQGLVLLPVLLSIVGPRPHATATSSHSSMSGPAAVLPNDPSSNNK